MVEKQRSSVILSCKTTIYVIYSSSTVMIVSVSLKDSSVRSVDAVVIINCSGAVDGVEMRKAFSSLHRKVLSSCS